MKYLAIDFGSKRTGLSISDETHTIASPLKVINSSDFNNIIDELKQINNIELIIIGYPLNMNGTKSERCENVLKLKELIEEKLNIKVELQDERLSTVEAEKILINNDTTRKNRKKVIDKIASTIILQTYLDKIKR